MKQYIMVIATALLVAAGCTRKQRVATLPKPPKLVMFIVIDQFPYEYITRFSPYFEKDGFQKLMDGGAYFTNCSYRQATTQTSVGHSVMMSGLDPSEHGITANYWYDRATQRKTYSCEDTSVSLIGMPTKSKYDGRSPHHFTGSNLADQLRFHTGFQSKVFGVSNKDRSAILMAGKRPNAAYWYNEAYGGVITSTYYMDAVPAWVSDYNAGKSYDRWAGETWTPVLTTAKYPVLTPDVFKMVNPPTSFYGTGFPHKLSAGGNPEPAYYKALMSSPFGSEELCDFTEKLIRHEAIGQDDVPDLLCVSFSSMDKVGHIFGPSSPEVMDMVIRMDRTLSRLIHALESQVDPDDILYVLTSDHASPPMPEDLILHRIDAGRVRPEKLERWIDSVMVIKYGLPGSGKHYSAQITYPDFYFNETALAEKKIDKEEAEDYISASLAKSGPGVSHAYPAYRLSRGEVAPDKVSQAVHRSFYPARSGDVVIVLKPYYLWDVDGYGTEHSLPYAYDAHVPLIVKGGHWIRSGIYSEPCSPANIAPTLATILGINASGGVGYEPIEEVLKFSK